MSIEEAKGILEDYSSAMTTISSSTKEDRKIAKAIDKVLLELYEDTERISDLQNEVTIKDNEIENQKYLIEQRDIEIIESKEANRQLSIELEKKDKVINLMSEQLSTDYHSQEWVIKYYENLVEKESK